MLKIENEVYSQLENLKVGRQTFSEVIEGILKAREKMLEALNVLEGALQFREWQRQRFLERVSADSVRRDVEARTIPRPSLKPARSREE